jgi:chromate reductase
MAESTTRVLAIPGSLRRDSYNRSLLNAAVALAPTGMTIRVYDSLHTVPLFNEDEEHPAPAGVADLRRAAAASDGLLIATPEYNQSVPGVVKNMIDWLSRSEGSARLAGKPVAIVGVTTGPWGTRLAQTILRQMLASTRALVLPEPMLFLREAASLFNPDRTLRDDKAVSRLGALLASFEQWIELVATRASDQSTILPR